MIKTQTSLKSLEALPLRGKRVLLRCDFNVPLLDGRITDDARIRASLKTLRYLISERAKILVLSHLGRPSSQKEPGLSLKPISVRLEELLGVPVLFVSDCRGELAQKASASLEEGQVALLENVRYYSQETDNELGFAKELASLADFFVNDAFGAVHRAHASTEGVAHFLPSAAGFLVMKEDQFLAKVLNKAQRPSLAIVGGSKVSSKITVLESLLQRMDTIIIGGAMAYTFLATRGYSVGNSLIEKDYFEVARSFMNRAKDLDVQVILPIDHRISEDASGEKAVLTTEDSQIPDAMMALDVGPKTLLLYQKPVLEAKTIIWNGPVGVFERKPFENGTKDLALLLARSSALTVVGGGDTVAALNQFDLVDSMTHVSTGGGASLEYLEGKALPGLTILREGRLR